MSRLKTIAILLNYNDAKTTLSLAQKLSQFDQLDLVMIVDNASSDDSLEKLNRANNTKIEVISAPQNGGYASGNNLGLQLAKSRYQPDIFMIANPDIDIDERTYDQCINFLKNAEDTIACVAPTMKLRKGRMNTAWKLPNYATMMMTAMIPVRPFLNSLIAYPASALNSEISKVDVLAGSLFFARASILEKSGYFDERTFLFGEENILAYKLKQAGYQNALLNHLEYLHLHSFSINKNFSQIKDKFKIAYQSDVVYLEHYLKASKLQIRAYQIQYHLWLMIFLGLKQVQKLILSGIRTVNFLFHKEKKHD